MPFEGEALARARSILAGARSLVVLTGAGISAESGLPTFRGSGGLWGDVPIEDVATPEGFARDPAGVWDWYNRRRAELKAARPNPAHLALAELERTVVQRGGSFILATQNIDGLHQAAGSRNVLELHGSMAKMCCTACPRVVDIGLDAVDPAVACGDCGRPMRPAVVWFGEPLPEDVYGAAVEAVFAADAFLSVGTSALVYPAAGLIEMARGTGARTIEVNLEPTPASRIVEVALHGKAGDVLPRMLPGE